MAGAIDAPANPKGDLPVEHVGPAMRVIRRSKGLTQKDVAERAGVTRAMLSAYERGHRRPSLKTLVRILGALDVTLAELGRAVEKIAEDGSPRGEVRNAKPGSEPA
ncbi:MAG TPA: helix-turn-helix transcriptional regulator [Thermoanaerobaculia bacterium]|nr:helix-turn-helix transcriptional regulator [Thermoanaerobaculia bacterium]